MVNEGTEIVVVGGETDENESPSYLSRADKASLLEFPFCFSALQCAPSRECNI